MILRTSCSMLLLLSVQQVLQKQSPCQAYWIPSVNLPGRHKTRDPQHVSPWLTSSRSQRHGRSPNCPRIVDFPLKHYQYPRNSNLYQTDQQQNLDQQLNTQHDTETSSGPGMEIDEVDKPKSNTWTPSDVYSDLAALERAIRLGNAPRKLQSEELEEKLNFMTQHCHPPLFHALRKYVLFPLALAWPVSILTRPGQSSGFLTTIANTFVRLFDVHFWTFVVGAPIVALTWKCICSPRDYEEVNDMNPRNSTRFLRDIPTMETEPSCDDHVVVLLEYWKSAVFGIAVFPLCQIFNQAIGREILLQQSSFHTFWWACSQFLTRMAAAASLFQFREPLYRLQRPSQPRPVGFFPFMTQILVRWMLVVIPLGMASDLSKIMTKIPNSSILNLYACLSIAMLGTWARMENLTLQDPLSRCLVLPPPPRKTKFVYGLSLAVIWREQTLWLLEKAFRCLAGNVDIPKLFERLDRMFSIRSMPLPRILLWCCPVIWPLAHLVAVSRIIQIVYGHDLPLTLTPDAYPAALGNNDEMQRRMKWRLRFEWRRNRRLSIRVEMLTRTRTFLYWLFLKRQADDTISDPSFFDTIREKKKEFFESDRRDGRKRPNRDQRKENIMGNLARIHQADYERNGAKNADDPLGVAVQQVFGIGLSFLFDYTSPLKEGQEPSPRRLQARAAKSAIRRLQVLNDAEREFDEGPRSMSDDEAREKRRKAIEAEKEALAKRLTELIPIVKSSDIKEPSLDCFELKFKKGSTSNELIVVRHPDYPFVDSPDGIVFSFEKLRRSVIASKSMPKQEMDEVDLEFVDFLADTRTIPPSIPPVATTEQEFQQESNSGSLNRPRSMLENIMLAKKYESVDAVEDRAYSIPLDLELVDEPSIARPPNEEPAPTMDDITEAEALQGRIEPLCDSERGDDDDPDDWSPTIVFV